VGRTLLWASLALAPATFLIDLVAHPGDVTLFVLAAASLVPLAWLIGEATEHAAEHTGPRIGGLLNASFGNAPELIIALLAVADSLPDVVRGSLTGSVVSNILLVLGVALFVAGEGRMDRRSLLRQLGLVALAVVLLLIPSAIGWSGDPERHSIAVVSIFVAVVLLLVYLPVTIQSIRRGAQAHAASDEGPSAESWSMTVSLVALGIATLATALISEILVHSLDAFAHAVGLSQFFISAVIVALVGNAAEHGGAVVIARRGKVDLASEIAISSSAQVALLVLPAITLLSWTLGKPLALSFRPVELAAMGGAAIFVAFVIRDGRSHRWEGALLVACYAAVAAAFFVAGDR
jgi:Ca2+:H+ antiporter